MRFHYNTTFFFSFVSKYNSSVAQGSHYFQTKYNTNLEIFIKNVLLPHRVIMGYRYNGDKLIIFLNPFSEVRFHISLIKKTRVFNSITKKYLSHVSRSSLPVVRDFYYLLTSEGLISLDQALIKKIGGIIVCHISFISLQN